MLNNNAESYKELEERLEANGLLYIQRDENKCITNYQILIDIAEFMGEIPLSKQVYKKIANDKKSHPSVVKDAMILSIAASFRDFYKRNRNIESLNKYQLDENLDLGDAKLIFQVIDELYSLQPIKKQETPDFYWFNHKSSEIKSKKELAESYKDLFANYKKEAILNDLLEVL